MPSDPWSDGDCAVLKIVNVTSHSGRDPRQTAGQTEETTLKSYHHDQNNNLQKEGLNKSLLLIPSDPWSDGDCAVLKIVNVTSHSSRQPRQTAGQTEETTLKSYHHDQKNNP